MWNKRDRIRPTRVRCRGAPGFQKKNWAKMSFFPSAQFVNCCFVSAFLHKYFINVDFPEPGFPDIWKMPFPEASHSLKGARSFGFDCSCLSGSVRIHSNVFFSASEMT